MKFTFLLALALLAAPLSAQNTNDEAAVRVPLENYFRGHATGDPGYFRKAFLPDAKLFWMKDGQLTQITSEEFIQRAGSGHAQPDEAQRKRTIESVEISGNAATARLLLDYPDDRITDFMSLLKVNGEWKIVNKIFYRESKTTR
jgi:hypothetical protein